MSLAGSVADLVGRGNVLIGVDFDGVLAPLVEHPDLAVPDPRAVSHLRRLAVRDNIEVAVISGRSLADLRERLGEIPGAVLVGEHGNDTGEEPPIPETIQLARRFVETLRGNREITIEIKPRSVTFHTRNLTEDNAQESLDRIRAWAGQHSDVNLLEGKQVVELTVASRTKGDAIMELARNRDGIIYIGDDLTDETVFAVLGPQDIGVKVGPGPTAARFRVNDVDAVVELLEGIVTSH